MNEFNIKIFPFKDFTLGVKKSYKFQDDNVQAY